MLLFQDDNISSGNITILVLTSLAVFLTLMCCGACCFYCVLKISKPQTQIEEFDNTESPISTIEGWRTPNLKYRSKGVNNNDFYK